MTATTPEIDAALRETVEALCALDRTPCTPGEREAAEWVAERLRAAGVTEVALEDEPSWGTFPPTLLALGAIGLTGAALTLAGRRGAGALAAVTALAGIADESHNGPRIFRRVIRRRRTTVNVVARAGDPNAGRTLVVLAHHDAPQTGLLFDQSVLKAIHARFPSLIEPRKTSPPQWWVGAGAQLLTIAGALTGRRRLTAGGVVLGALATAAVADIARSATVPGANDNASGVAGLVGAAEVLREQPISGLRVLLVSCGAEETLQDGIRAFMARHGGELAAGRTWFLNLDTVGSPNLGLLEAEGPLWMENYTDPAFRDLVVESAAGAGVKMERGLRARSSTDSVIPSRAGHPTACLVSTELWKGLSNYHLPTDVPENVDYGTVADAVRVVDATARRLAG
jgi:Zn-dependent M28 family amino/carboxypeptidase